MTTSTGREPLPTRIPHGRTALRLQWSHLPPGLRREVERRLGSEVVLADSCDGGFTPGLASVLTCADGSRHFLKAASVRAQRTFAAAHREEARKLAALPEEAPAPRLRWAIDDDAWVVLCLEHVEGRPPHRPWTSADLAAMLAALERSATLLTPPPADLALESFADDLADLPGLWHQVRSSRPDLPAAWVDQAQALADRLPDATAGRTVVHTDVRDDNVLVRADGTAILCDWSWPVVGAAWIDTVAALIGPRGDGLDVEAVLAASPLTSEVPADDVDCLLALLAGYFWHSADQPVPPSSPHLRDAQAWQAEVVWDWLRERRGWG